MLTNFKNFSLFSEFPHIVFLMNLSVNTYTCNEALIIKVPVLGLVDSNENPCNLIYPIPSNSKSLSSALFILLLLFRLLAVNKFKLLESFNANIKLKLKSNFKLLKYLNRFILLGKNNDRI